MSDQIEDTARRVLAAYETFGDEPDLRNSFRLLSAYEEIATIAAPDLAREVLRLRRVERFFYQNASELQMALFREALAASEPDDERGATESSVSDAR